MSSAASTPSQEFLVPDGHTGVSTEERIEAARRNEENATYLLRLESYLDKGHSFAEADSLAKGESR